MRKEKNNVCEKAYEKLLNLTSASSLGYQGYQTTDTNH